MILKEPVDAYEFSFVAVPAQRGAGVIKGMGRKACLKELAEEFGAQGEYQALWKEAQLGREYRRELETEFVRLGLALELGVEAPVLRNLARTAGAEELKCLKEALEGKLQMMMPVVTQLGNGLGKCEEVESEYLI